VALATGSVGFRIIKVLPIIGGAITRTTGGAKTESPGVGIIRLRIAGVGQSLGQHFGLP
jgi:hypothetical protein